MTTEEFVNVTEQFNYGCDGGALSIVVDGQNFDIQNCVGDGEGTVYINSHSLFGVRMPFTTELVLSFGCRDKYAPDITVGMRRFDIDKDSDPVMIVKGQDFSISRIRGTHDFIIDVRGNYKVLRRPKSNKVGTVFDDDEYIDIYDDDEKSRIASELEAFLLKSAELKEWPTQGNPLHWLIVVKDEAWFNELAHLHQNEDKSKGDFTEIHFVPDNFIHFAGCRGNVIFSGVSLYSEEEKLTYTLKEGIEKLTEFILDGKIDVPGFRVQLFHQGNRS